MPHGTVPYDSEGQEQKHKGSSFLSSFSVSLNSVQFLQPSQEMEDLVNAKNQQRAALKKEYLKQVTNPHSADGGHVFDPALQRFLAMKATRVEFFRETPKTTFKGLMFLAVPFALTIMLVKWDRDTKEAKFRRGEVAYKDRLFKFQ